MFKITVLKLKDIAKIIGILFFIYILSTICLNKIEVKEYLNQFGDFSLSDFTQLCINTQSNIIKNIQQSNDSEIEKKTEIKDFTKYIFQIGSNTFKTQDEITETVIEDETTEETNEEKIEENEATILAQATENVSTEVVTENPIEETYNREYLSVKIKNGTSYELTDETLNTDNLNINTENIIIFHTHTCESYTQSENFQYEFSGNYRTTDLNYSVARVGDELTNYLLNYGFNVMHDKTYHDYPSYTGSYTRSLQTVQNILQTFSSDIIIDLHRDAIGSDETYAPLVKIGDDYCAQLMFVIGTDGSGLTHENWRSNLKFAVKIQEVANELYPGLFKPIILRNSRYNQHLGTAACIIEVGATGNTMEQTLNSMKYLSKIMEEALK